MGIKKVIDVGDNPYQCNKKCHYFGRDVDHCIHPNMLAGIPVCIDFTVDVDYYYLDLPDLCKMNRDTNQLIINQTKITDVLTYALKAYVNPELFFMEDDEVEDIVMTVYWDLFDEKGKVRKL